jgi:undecaprenyl-diphosphatase
MLEALWKMIVLAAVQGLAEFLPISSSGHLVLLGQWLDLSEDTATVNILLHAGTLASILVVFWQRILRLLTSDRNVIPMLIVASIPAGIAGVVIKKRFEYLIESPWIAAPMLLVTAALLLLLPRLPAGSYRYGDFPWWRAFVVGCFQAVAILPGISRSGATIVGGRLLGLQRDDAVTFSFLMAIPVIAGATLLEAKDLLTEPLAQERWVPLLVGTVISFLIGIVALHWLIRWSRLDRLHWFVYWLIPFSLASMVALAFSR